MASTRAGLEDHRVKKRDYRKLKRELMLRMECAANKHCSACRREDLCCCACGKVWTVAEVLESQR